ncbi:hypothetical protein CU098_007571, partial [Rhizopus stolonifer]
LQKEKTAVVTIPVTEAPSHSIIGVISSVGVVNLSIRILEVQPKKGPKGTTTGHRLRFLNETLNIMDKHHEMRESYLIMDNTPIHTLNQMEEVVKGRNRNYKFVHLPPYLPEPKPIEKF